ncbi:MAG: calcium/sodium antiporter, partial [Actinomycetota bacterium]
MEFLTEPSVPVAIIQVLIGVGLLAKAADVFVEGAANIAGSMRISPVVIGAVLIGFGTSLPELLVSGLAATDGNLDLGVGNIVGSNVANLTLVLGAAALIVPVVVSRAVLGREAPLSLLAVLLFAFFTMDGLARWEGIVLLCLLVVVLSWIMFAGREEVIDSLSIGTERSLPMEIVQTVFGLVGTVLGAQLLVWGAVAIAEAADLSGGLVGFTLVAVGTSLPELVTAVAAARKNETELIVGNLLGSNVFNSLAVGGVIAVLANGPIDDRALATYGVVGMAIVATLAWGFMVTRRRLHRIEASALLAMWMVAVVLMASEQDELAGAMLGAIG